MSEMLCAFLDGELEGAEAETLFYMLANNQELQLEMRKLIALNAGFRKELLAPPDRLRHSIEQHIGRSAAPAAVAGVPVAPQSLLMSVLSNRALLMLASAVCAVLLTLRFAEPSGQEQAPVSSAAPQQLQKQAELRQQAGGTGAGTAGSAEMSTQEQQSNTSKNNGRQETASLHEARQQSRATTAGRKRGTKEQRQEMASTTDIADADNHRITAISPIENIAPESSLRTIEIDKPAIGPVAASIGSAVDVPPYGADVAPPYDADAAHRLYALHLRGFSARSAPDFDVDPLATPTLNDIGIGLSYRLGKEHSIGMEVGQENLLQRYIDTARGVRKTIEQNYLAFWGGATYRFSPDFGGTLQPYIQTFLGGTRTGPMARSIIGVEYRTGALGIAAGMEGTLHVYRYQKTWYSIRKLGLTYSLSFHF